MYDTINGEQVKCFPWVSLYNGEISYHGGDMKYYGYGDKVPYKKPHYNYGKNFIILDFNRFPDYGFCDYDYILHVIVDGKVKDFFKDETGDIDWYINKNVVGYYGDFLNINSNEDILNYINDEREHFVKREQIRKHWEELFKKSMKYSYGIATIDKDSEEFKMRREKIEEIQNLMDEEYKRIEPELNALSDKYSTWYVDTSDINDLVNLGDYISAYRLERDNQEECKQMIQQLLNSDDTLYDRYVRWQGSDEYIKEFIELEGEEI